MRRGFIMTKQEALREYFGHGSFREAQEGLVDCILSGRDCVGVMPTGAGKSVCFQLPAMLMSGTSLVISPLISLMRDQVDALVQNGISAACINSMISEKEFSDIYQRALGGEFKILYVAPERLETPRFSELAGSLEIPLVAIDEAHCVSHWGQDFRPSYLKITGFVKSLKKRPVVAAFTATATERVKRDIVDILELNDPLQVTTGFDRPNLFFEVRKPEDKDAELVGILKNAAEGSVIVYCATRKNVESVCGMLRRNGFRAGEYHAGFTAAQRTEAQEDFIFDRVDVMVATNAFGMGIDKSNVRLVVHYNCPKDLESYYQEAGRAGRDGGAARCILLYGPSDKRLARFMIESGHRDSGLPEKEIDELIKRDLIRLDAMSGYCKTKACLRRYILNYFGENADSSCGYCGSCTKDDEVCDVTVEAQKILSCVFRLKQRGEALPLQGVCRILTGDFPSGVFDTLSTFGIMRGEDGRRVLQIAEFLVSEGYIEEFGEQKRCALTPKADEFIKSKKTLVMRFSKGKRAARKNVEIAVPELFEELRALRKKLAAALGVPPYVVFSDATLNSMCVILPKNIEEFLTVPGVGTMKAERYGRKFLAVINNYIKAKPREGK